MQHIVSMNMYIYICHGNGTNCLLIIQHWVIIKIYSLRSQAHQHHFIGVLHHRCLHSTNSDTEAEMSSFWWHFHQWQPWKLSFWQLPVQPLMKISSKWQHFFSGCSLTNSWWWEYTYIFDSFMSSLHSLLGYSTGEFQALQLIVLAVFGAVD